MDERTLETLELGALIDLAARHVQTPSGRKRLERLRPSADAAEIAAALDLTGECVEFLAASGRFGLAGVEDLDPVMQRLHIEGTALEPRQILALERLLAAGKGLRESIRAAASPGHLPILGRMAAGIPDTRPLLEEIHGKILPSGEIDDGASPGLRAVRREIAERRHRIQRTLESILRASPQAVQEDIITFRNGRFVIPVRTDSRTRVPGVMHGLSSSGQTTFVEPMSVIDQNNDLVRLRDEEGIEIARILRALTDLLRHNADSLRVLLELVTELDVAQARALFAEEFQCVAPRISGDGTCELADARHPVLEHSLRRAGGAPVPISLELDGEHNVLVISGPNAGGKTVALKTAGLLALMTQMGFHVPARAARLPVFGQVFADIGDHQSIAANLSTFTAHMRNIAEAAGRLAPPALVLLDEVGTGTDPDEGAALAIAIVDHFRRSGAVTIASTHYPRLKMWAEQTPGVRNASVEFDERTLRPTYRLILGTAGASSGIEIARRMRLPEEIAAAAAALIEPDHARAREYLRRLKEALDEQESLGKALVEERAAVALKYSSLERDFARKEQERASEFTAALERVVADFQKESEGALRAIRDRTEAARARRAVEGEAARLRRRAGRLGPAAAEAGSAEGGAPSAEGGGEIGPGDRVRVLALDREGVVEGIQGETFVVAIGALRYRSERGDLLRLGPGSPPERAAYRADPPEEAPAPARELKVIGLTADEALDRVDRFLDQAVVAGLETVRIIHGHGKGILRRAIAEYLSSHPQVERFALAPPEGGGGGATVVELCR
ncbi:MAG: Smr/MutS family protein [Acidobacteria bacterium]|nr:Smr/MutS family protein [Acidobacteriota bacterium]